VLGMDKAAIRTDAAWVLLLRIVVARRRPQAKSGMYAVINPGLATRLRATQRACLNHRIQQASPGRVAEEDCWMRLGKGFRRYARSRRADSVFPFQGFMRRLILLKEHF